MLVTSFFLILRLGAPTGIHGGVFPVFKRFILMILLMFSVISRISLSVFTFRTQSYLRLGEAIVSLFMPIITAWTEMTLKTLIGFFMSLTAPRGSRETLTMRGSLAFLCRSRPPQLPTAAMKALGGFFTSCN